MKKAATLILFTIQWASINALDWPTYRHDAQRTGITSEQLALPLSKSWTICVPTPTRAGMASSIQGKPILRSQGGAAAYLRPRLPADRLRGIRSFLVRQVIIRSTVLTQHQVTSNGHFIQRDRFASVQHSIREGFISDRMTELFIASMPKQGRSIGVILRAQAMIRFPGTNKLFPVGRYAPVYLSRKDSFIRPQGCSRRERDPIYLHLMPTRGKMYGRKK